MIVVIYTRLSKNGNTVMKVLSMVSPLFDARRDGLEPRGFWRKGTFFTHPARVKAVFLNLAPGRPLARDYQVKLARKVMVLLETRKGMVMDWCGGVSKNRGRVVLVIKTLACDLEDGRNREVWLEPDDLEAVARLVPKRERLGRWKREREMYRLR